MTVNPKFSCDICLNSKLHSNIVSPFEHFSHLKKESDKTLWGSGTTKSSMEKTKGECVQNSMNNAKQKHWKQWRSKDSKQKLMKREFTEENKKILKD